MVENYTTTNPNDQQREHHNTNTERECNQFRKCRNPATLSDGATLSGIGCDLITTNRPHRTPTTTNNRTPKEGATLYNWSRSATGCTTTTQRTEKQMFHAKKHLKIPYTKGFGIYMNVSRKTRHSRVLRSVAVGLAFVYGSSAYFPEIGVFDYQQLTLSGRHPTFDLNQDY
jgi:hypothetical protein